MFCDKCYADLSEAKDNRCPACGKEFDPKRPSTFYKRPFPDALTIVRTIVVTTVLAGIVAYVVSMFQMAATSGH